MMRFEKPVKFSEPIKPIEVSTKIIVEGDEIEIISWALKISLTDDLLGRIKYFKVKAIGKENCVKNDAAKVICLGDFEGEKQKVNVSSVCMVKLKKNFPRMQPARNFCGTFENLNSTRMMFSGEDCIRI